MNYNEFEQHICENGHRFDWQYDSDGHNVKCTCCGGETVFYNSVINCDRFGIIIDWESLQLTPEKTAMCNLGHIHIVEHATYRIPTEKELNDLRCYLSKSGKFNPAKFYNEG